MARKVWAVLPAAALVLAASGVQAAEPGWSTSIDPRGRAFVRYVDAESKEAFLTIRCLRDVDIIGAAVEGLGLPKKGKRLTLTAAGGTFTIAGAVTSTKKTTEFDGETAATEKSLRNLQKVVVDVLAGDGDIMIKVGDATVAGIPPISDVKTLRKFLTVCFDE
jgi:hypothetical protein